MTNKKMNEVQYAELSLAKKFKLICEQNNLKYFMLGGAMLGAVRHKGFIPWDDDLDFGLLREHYEKLYQLLSDKQYGLKICSFRKKDSHDYPFKIIDSSVVLINKNHKVQQRENAWIDIFPIDGLPNNSFHRKLHMIRLLKDRALLKLSQLKTGVALSNPDRTKLEKAIINVGSFIQIDKLLNEGKMMRRLDQDLKRFNTDESNYLVNFMGAYKFNEMFPRNLYLRTKNYSFEDTNLTGIKNFDDYLTQLYGNYLLPPQKKDRDKHRVELEK